VFVNRSVFLALPNQIFSTELNLNQFTEEGYNVLHVRLNVMHFSADVQNVVQELQLKPDSPFGILSFELDDDHLGGLKKLSQLSGLKAAVHYTPATEDGIQLVLRSMKGALIK
jgi:hypothetical protein